MEKEQKLRMRAGRLLADWHEAGCASQSHDEGVCNCEEPRRKVADFLIKDNSLTFLGTLFAADIYTPCKDEETLKMIKKYLNRVPKSL